MITREDHATAKALLDAGTWKLGRGLFRTIEIETPGGARELLEAMKLRQVLDNLHHAPCCPANHWHRARLVFQPCTCGANREMREGATSPPLRAALAKPDAEPPANHIGEANEMVPAVADAAEGATHPCEPVSPERSPYFGRTTTTTNTGADSPTAYRQGDFAHD